MKIGDPLDRSTDHGPQNHRAHMEKLVEYCDIGVKEGATLVTGGKQVDRPGESGLVYVLDQVEFVFQFRFEFVFRLISDGTIVIVNVIVIIITAHGKDSISVLVARHPP